MRRLLVTTVGLLLLAAAGRHPPTPDNTICVLPASRVVSDPYPTLHSVVVDPDRNRVFFSDPNRHALWSYDRLAASKGREAVQPLTSIRGPATGMVFIAAVTIDAAAQE